jgi:acyl-CoA synthetase (AMP-forming)/AMP-acid ligase II
MIIRSPHPDVEIPDIPLTAYVLAGADEWSERPALVDGASGRTLTYAQLAGAVRRVAGGFAQRGVGKGDVVALFSPNVPEYAVAFHALASLGAVSCTVNSLFTADEVAFELRDSGARFLVTVPPFLDRAAPAAAAAGVEEVFVFGEADGATPFAKLLEAGEPPEVEIDPAEDLVTLPYSSGTTGFPKGVMLTHRNLVANLAQCRVAHRVSESEIVLGVLPFFHIYGLIVIMNAAVSTGATVVTMPRFDLAECLRLIQEYRITRAYLVPPIVLALAKHPLVDEYDVSSLEVVLSGAAPLGADLADACEERLGCRVVQGYGLTETSPVTHVVPDGAENRPGSVGPALPNTECRVIDIETGADLGPGETGELWIRGPQVMKGYLNNPEATAATIDSDGWLHTGDIAQADEDGWFAIVDRLKELIKYKGYQVPPAELEALLVAHPAVADAAVVPSPDEEAGEVPKAYVVLKDEATPEEIMAFVADRVAPHKKVRRLEVVDEIPKSPSGKILRRVLVERERGVAAG